MVYTLTLNPALDYVMKVGALHFDEINRCESETFYCGGKGINVSTVLSRLGVANQALGFVAGFTGNALEAMLKEEGITCDFLHLSDGLTRINVKIKAGMELDINANGPKVSEEEMDALMHKLNCIGAGDYLILAGTVPNNLPHNIYERILEALAGKGVQFVVDTTGQLLLNTLKYKPFLVKPNHQELGDLFGTITETDEQIEYFAEKL